MNHEDDMRLIDNYYQCPKEEYYNQQLFGKVINRNISKRNLRRKDNEDPLLKSSRVKFPKTICEEDAIASMGVDKMEMEMGNDETVCDSIDGKNKNMKKLDAITKFGLYFLRSAFKNSTFVAHNR